MAGRLSIWIVMCLHILVASQKVACHYTDGSYFIVILFLLSFASLKILVRLR